MKGIKPRRPSDPARDLVSGVYDLVLLEVLRDGPADVYELIRRVDEQSGHAFQWRQGTVCHVAHDLERRGFVRSQWVGATGGRRRSCGRLPRAPLDGPGSACGEQGDGLAAVPATDASRT